MPKNTLLSRLAVWMRTPEPALPGGFAVSIGLALAIALLAGGLRFNAAERLPMDWDEYVTLRAAYVYAAQIESKRLWAIPDTRINNEHPPGVKIVYGMRLKDASRPPIPPRHRGGQPIPESLRENVVALRRLASIAGAAEVAALALVQPGAGLWMAVQSYHTRYTAEILLDPVAGFFAVWAVVFFGLAWQPRHPGRIPEWRWPAFFVSASALGFAAASKYMYGLPAIVLLPFLLVRTPRPGPLLGFAGIAAASFIAAHPGLWHQPWELVSSTLAFHSEFATEHQRSWWHPLALMSHVVYDDAHASLFGFGFILDRGLLCFAILGLPRTAMRRPVWFAWALAGVVFLLIWPTKWAHYQLLAVPPLSMCAAAGVRTLYTRLLPRQRRTEPAG